MPEIDGVKYEVYKGYTIAPGVQMPTYDIYEYDVFENVEALRRGDSLHTAESETEAKQWVDTQEGTRKEVRLGKSRTWLVRNRYVTDSQWQEVEAYSDKEACEKAGVPFEECWARLKGEPLIGSPEPAYYWEVVNTVTGEILQSGKKHESIEIATHDAKKELQRGFKHYGSNRLLIKIFDKSPDEREGLAYEPVRSEFFWVVFGDLSAGNPSTTNPPAAEEARPPSEILPQTYGDWIDLAIDVKEKDPNDLTLAGVNRALGVITGQEEGDPDAAKEWLMKKARELGVR